MGGKLNGIILTAWGFSIELGKDIKEGQSGRMDKIGTSTTTVSNIITVYRKYFTINFN